MCHICFLGMQKNMDKGGLGGTILRYWKSSWGSKFASQEDHVVQNNNQTHRQNHLNLIALTYCNHIRPHVCAWRLSKAKVIKYEDTTAHQRPCPRLGRLIRDLGNPLTWAFFFWTKLSCFDTVCTMGCLLRDLMSEQNRRFLKEMESYPPKCARLIVLKF
jgi:hypothetical protein